MRPRLRTLFFTEHFAMNNTDDETEIWTPCEDIFENYKENNYAVLILNCRISMNIDHRKILSLWNNANLRVTVDGGTKRWLSWLEAHQCEESDIVPPDLITGDMDSLSEDLLDYFKKRNSKIIETPDQDETDFTKALRELRKYCDNTSTMIDIIFVFGDTSGRFDQIIANINTLFVAKSFMENTKLYQIASDSITWLLEPGQHRISIPEKLREKQEWCALIPIGGPCVVSSKGLKWNLGQTNLAFGDMVSTSNSYNGEPFVDVTNSNLLIFSMGIESIL